jgi:hypothetical protein
MCVPGATTGYKGAAVRAHFSDGLLFFLTSLIRFVGMLANPSSARVRFGSEVQSGPNPVSKLAFANHPRP